MTTAYKVVHVGRNGKLYSGMVHHTAASREYKLDAFTEADGRGPLFVFELFSDARNWRGSGNCNTSRIYRCEIRNPRQVAWIASWTNPETFTRFWRREYGCRPGLVRAPRGTIVCDAVKLLEDVT